MGWYLERESASPNTFGYLFGAFADGKAIDLKGASYLSDKGKSPQFCLKAVEQRPSNTLYPFV